MPDTSGSCGLPGRARPRRPRTALLLCLHLHSVALLLGLLLYGGESAQTPAQQATDDAELFTSAADDARFRELQLGSASEDQLAEYKQFLEARLINVTRAMRRSRERLKAKRFIPLPVSASLPDRQSQFVLARLAQVPAAQRDETEPAQLAPDSAEAEQRSAEAEPSAAETQPTAAPAAEDLPEAEASVEERPAAEREHQHRPKAFSSPTIHFGRTASQSFNPTQNHTFEECKRLSQAELVRELKQKGTYNPDLMAWDVSGVFRFLDRSIIDQYETKTETSSQQAVQKNVQALERILSELNLQCDLKSPEVLSKINNLTLSEPRRSVLSPSLRMDNEELNRFKRHSLAGDLLKAFNSSRRRDEVEPEADGTEPQHQKLIGEVHVVPFGCDKRGEREDGFLRLCSACQAIRKLPESFFPPFINEVMCDEDKACLYFYDYPHGKCKQKHMNFVVLRNVGTPQCQVWQKFNLNVRVSCECFVDEMSFFAKYV